MINTVTRWSLAFYGKVLALNTMDAQLRDAIVSGRRSFWVPILGTVGIGIACTLCWLHFNQPFDTERWRDTPNARRYMIGDFLNNNDLTGMSRNEVDALLGTPNNGRDSHAIDMYTYWVKPDMIDDWWLEVEFRDSRVTSVRYYPD